MVGPGSNVDGRAELAEQLWLSSQRVYYVHEISKGYSLNTGIVDIDRNAGKH